MRKFAVSKRFGIYFSFIKIKKENETMREIKSLIVLLHKFICSRFVIQTVTRKLTIEVRKEESKVLDHNFWTKVMEKLIINALCQKYHAFMAINLTSRLGWTKKNLMFLSIRFSTVKYFVYYGIIRILSHHVRTTPWLKLNNNFSC